jgi:hypothetical protein
MQFQDAGGIGCRLSRTGPAKPVLTEKKWFGTRENGDLASKTHTSVDHFAIFSIYQKKPALFSACASFGTPV